MELCLNINWHMQVYGDGYRLNSIGTRTTKDLAISYQYNLHTAPTTTQKWITNINMRIPFNQLCGFFLILNSSLLLLPGIRLVRLFYFNQFMTMHIRCAQWISTLNGSSISFWLLYSDLFNCRSMELPFVSIFISHIWVSVNSKEYRKNWISAM